MRALLSLIFGLAVLGTGYVGYMIVNNQLPQSYIPWAPLELSEPPGLFTGWKINNLKNDTIACYAALNTIELNYKPVPDRDAGQCSLTNQVFLEQSTARYSAPVTTKCALMVALVGWEKHVLQPLAQEHFNSTVASITHYGTFSCRNVRGSNRVSQHSYANAIDIAAFRLADGTSISVLQDWGTANKKADFLQDVHEGACTYFKGVLGPDYNSLHADHFHLDLGSYSICR